MRNLEKALDSASFPVLAALLVHFTGDISILDKLPKPNQAILGEVQGFLSEKDKAKIKKMAIQEIDKLFSNLLSFLSPVSFESISRIKSPSDTLSPTLTFNLVIFPE